jgi:hypothetical protein
MLTEDALMAVTASGHCHFHLVTNAKLRSDNKHMLIILTTLVVKSPILARMYNTTPLANDEMRLISKELR